MDVEVREDPQWGRLLWLTDGRTEAAASLDFGIRVVHLSAAGRENLFYRQPEEERGSGLYTRAGWRLYGGHRLWLTPESQRSYYPDREPVEWTQQGGGVILRQRPDPWLGVEKTLELHFDRAGRIQAVHRVRNVSDAPLDCGLWAVSAMAAGARLRAPFAPPARKALTPTRFMALWDDTDLGDPRLSFAGGEVRARHLDMDPAIKLGLYTVVGEATVENLGQRFVKQFGCVPGRTYPDNNCNFELYLCRQMLCVESLGPVTRLRPGESADHWERWGVWPLAEGGEEAT